jgi:hypothetical protein
MSAPTKHILEVVSFGRRNVFNLWHPVVEATIHSFRAATSRKVATERSLSSLLELVSLGKTSVELWMTSVERCNPQLASLFVLEELVIPDVVVAIALFVRTFLDRLVSLATSRSLHPRVDFQVSKLPIHPYFIAISVTQCLLLSVLGHQVVKLLVSLDSGDLLEFVFVQLRHKASQHFLFDLLEFKHSLFKVLDFLNLLCFLIQLRQLGLL